MSFGAGRTKAPAGSALAEQSVDFLREPIQILLVGLGDEVGDTTVVFGRVENLAPADVGGPAGRGEADRQEEVMAVEVFEHDAAFGQDFDEDAFVPIVLAVGAVHVETPVSAGL